MYPISMKSNQYACSITINRTWFEVFGWGCQYGLFYGTNPPIGQGRGLVVLGDATLYCDNVVVVQGYVPWLRFNVDRNYHAGMASATKA